MKKDVAGNVKHKRAKILTNGNGIMNRLKKYFEHLVRMNEDRTTKCMWEAKAL